MGQKINPIGFRLGINRTWDSRWFAEGREYGQLLQEDLQIRKYLKKELRQSGISKIRPIQFQWKTWIGISLPHLPFLMSQRN